MRVSDATILSRFPGCFLSDEHSCHPDSNTGLSTADDDKSLHTSMLQYCPHSRWTKSFSLYSSSNLGIMLTLLLQSPILLSGPSQTLFRVLHIHRPSSHW